MAKAKTAIQHELSITTRAEQGTRPVRRLRQQGLVPAVVYGRDMEPLSVSVNHRELVRLLHSKKGEHALVTLRLQDMPDEASLPAQKIAGQAGAKSGGTSWEKPALVHAVQHDPVDGRVVHVDFHAILLTERVKVKAPLILMGEPVGVKQEGGVLEHFLREVEVECLPTEIPSGVEFDVSALKIGDTVHVRELVPPKGAKILSDPEGVIASVQKPKEEKPAEEAAPVAEPEVLREKKPEAEAGAAAEVAKPAAEAKKEKDKS
jgi:large subunit ribosomal protein L25